MISDEAMMWQNLIWKWQRWLSKFHAKITILPLMKLDKYEMTILPTSSVLIFNTNIQLHHQHEC